MLRGTTLGALRTAGARSNLLRAQALSSTAPDAPVFKKILVANRGEIACRVMTTAKRMGIKTVAVYSQPEALARHVQMADEAYCIGPAKSADSYLRIDRIMEVIKKTGAEAVHPGYGFLSENAAFCKAVSDAGVAFVGPPVRAIKAMGDKIESKQIAIDAGINTIPGYQGVLADEAEAVKISREVGYPVMIKASAGGGGKGMRIAWNDDQAREGFRLSTQEAMASFGDNRLFVEKFIEEPHHIEIQLVADKYGKVVCFPERECSIQRRNQKVLEESPSMLLTPETRAEMCRQATMLALAVGYTSAGTIEFLADKHQNFYFLEMNTRLQVEHPVTEFVGQVDLVEQMFRVAAGQHLAPHLTTEKATKNIHGWALEARVYAEDPLRGFLPSNGSLLKLIEPRNATAFNIDKDIRVDSGLLEGMEISTHYDPMIAKLVTHGNTRTEAIDRMETALDEYVIQGSHSFAHNTAFLSELCRSERFRSGHTPTSFIQEEFPTGFHGVSLRKAEVLRTCVAALIIHTDRKTTMVDDASNMLSGGGNDYTGSSDGPMEANTEWIVTLQDDGHSSAMKLAGGARSFAVAAIADGELDEIQEGTEGALRVVPICPTTGQMLHDQAEVVMVAGVDWSKEAPLVEVDCGDGLGPKCVQYHGPSTDAYCAYKMVTAGAQLKVSVHSPKELAYAKHMLAPEVKDTSNMIQSPMPGTLVSMAVKDGQTIQAGQEVCVVEAMKMQNVLRAPRAGVVAKVHAKPGDSLKVDQLIASLAPKEELKK